MEDFINSRIKKWIFCNSIWSEGKIEESLHLVDDKQMRNLRIFPLSLWKLKSSIAIYDNKVLILNLNWVFTGVIIENQEFSITMESIFSICVR